MKIGFIGCGNMATAMLKGILKSGEVAATDMIASAKSDKTRKKIEQELGIQKADTNAQVVDFADYEQLEKTANGAFRSNAQPQGVNGTVIKQGYLEDSNVSMVQEMTNMMSGQRSLQSSAQLLKMYDQLSGKAIQLGSM